MDQRINGSTLQSPSQHKKHEANKATYVSTIGVFEVVYRTAAVPNAVPNAACFELDMSEYANGHE